MNLTDNEKQAILYCSRAIEYEETHGRDTAFMLAVAAELLREKELSEEYEEKLKKAYLNITRMQEIIE